MESRAYLKSVEPVKNRIPDIASLYTNKQYLGIKKQQSFMKSYKVIMGDFNGQSVNDTRLTSKI